MPTRTLRVDFRPQADPDSPIAVGFWGHVHMLTLEEARVLSRQLTDVISRLAEVDGKVVDVVSEARSRRP